MKRINKDIKSPKFVPDYTAKSLAEVDFDELVRRGVKYIAFDADATLVHYRGKMLSDETKKLLQQNRKKFQAWVIASNRITNDLLPLAESMDAQVIRATIFTRKPSKRFFARVIKFFGGKPEQIAMIGDKLIADVYGANRAGMISVWVEKIGKDSRHDRLLMVRRWELKLVNKYLN